MHRAFAISYRHLLANRFDQGRVPVAGVDSAGIVRGTFDRGTSYPCRNGSYAMAENRNEPIVISGEKARQGQIVLRKRWQRVAFVAGLAGVIVLGLVVPNLMHH